MTNESLIHSRDGGSQRFSYCPTCTYPLTCKWKGTCKKTHSESGDTARTPADAAETQPTVPGAVLDAGEGASSPGRSLAEIRATGAAWITEGEIARICDAVNEAETLTSRAHDALYADPFDRQAASDAIWKIHDVLRGLRDGG